MRRALRNMAADWLDGCVAWFEFVKDNPLIITNLCLIALVIEAWSR